MRPSQCPHVAPRGVLALATTVLTCAVLPVHAQSSSGETGEMPANVQRKLTVIVMPFEFAAPLPGQPRRVPPHRPSIWPSMLGGPAGVGRAPFFAPRYANGPAAEPKTYPTEGQYDEPGEAIGIGIADLLVERLLEIPGFRIVERRRADLLTNEHRFAMRDSLGPRDTAGAPGAPGAGAMLRPRYIITGSVTRFGTDERRALGGLGGAFGLGALGFKRPKTQVALTARIIDAATGEIVAGVSGVGTSTKGGGLLIGGIGGGVGGGIALGSSEFRASALGEATKQAIDQLVSVIVVKRERLE